MEIFKESKSILDAPQEGQTGRTIRTIECIGTRRKIITTNTDIVNYDFYLPANMLIYQGSVNPYDDFFISNYVDIPNEIYSKYSLNNWLQTMLFENI